MNIPQLFHTIIYLKPQQIIFQLKNFVVKPNYISLQAPNQKGVTLMAEPIPRYKSVEGDRFTFLNIPHVFSKWDFTGNGMLWTYNQNYFDWINQKDISEEEACGWIDQFITDLPSNRVGLDPYPMALRCINWVKFFCIHPNTATNSRLDSLWSQYKLLERKLEYHLLGNHLLEDAFSLTVGGYFFGDERLRQKGVNLMLQELKEQILPDGAHYEQSPMYHCILLDRLLDVYNITGIAELVPYAQSMLGHLESICYADGSWPFFGDAALGIAPMPEDIKDYARRLGITCGTLPLKECGYRKMKSEWMEAFVDVGNIKATYQPGHSHADALNFELRIDGKPFIVDTGISTYDKNSRRQYERSTPAHNTVTVEDRDSSDVWGGFRVGKRCHVICITDEGHCIDAFHDGFSHIHRRQFSINDNRFVVSDICKAQDCVAHLHFDPAIRDISLEDNIIHTPLADIMVTGGSTSIVLTDCEVSTEYNNRLRSMEALISFNGECVVSIEAKAHI